MAQAPKWIDKAKQAVFSVVTYDANDAILRTGNGFCIGEDGTALSDYSLFRNAQRAVVFTADGTQLPVKWILGVNDLYDVIKFQVNVTVVKKVQALTVAAVTPATGSEIYLLPYSTQKDRSYTSGLVSDVTRAGEGNNYYTLGLRLADKMSSCPLTTSDGQVFALAQRATGADTATTCYGVDARFASALAITAFSVNDKVLKTIGIRKALPDTEEQAVAFLYIASTSVSAEEYGHILDCFIEQYPRSAEGYSNRATHRMTRATTADEVALVASDLDRAMSLTSKPDETRYTRGRLMYAYLMREGVEDYPAWTLQMALDEVRQAIKLNPLPLYIQLQGDIEYAMEDYAAALESYDIVNRSELASAASLYNTARCKEMLEAPGEEILALLDSCVNTFNRPYTKEVAPYLFERAQARMNYGKARDAVMDYDDYYNAVNGQVNDYFYYLRAQASVKAKQYQRGLDDLQQAIEINGNEPVYRAELASLNIRVGRNEEAVAIVEDMLKTEPDYAEGYRLLGLAKLQMGLNEEGCAALTKAHELGDELSGPLIEKYCK